MDGETIDLLAKAAGSEAAVAGITEAAMQGQLDFFEALCERVQLLKGLAYQQVLDICHNLPLMPGAADTVAALKERGYRVVIFSGGFREATRHYASLLGAHADFANYLHHKNGLLSGQVGGEMMRAQAKGEMLERLQQLLGVHQADTVAVGDGANDLSMFQHAGLKVAFCAKPVLKQAADISIEEKDLRRLLEYL